MPVNHKVEEGDSVIALSEEHGLFADTIWNDPHNAELKRKRKDMNVLMPGDEVYIRDKRLKERDKPTGKLHRFRRKGIPALYRLQIFDIEEPRAHQAYRLIVDGTPYEGETDAEGVLEEFIPATSREGELIIGPDEFRLLIRFGYMDPINEVAGVQKRLSNLGYDCGEPDNELNNETREALKDFQRRFKLEPTGEPDDATLKKLQEVQDHPFDFPDEQQKRGGKR